MVKITKCFKKEIVTTIKLNLKKFILLTFIIFLGVSFYVGMKSNAPTLISTMVDELEKRNYMDIEIVSYLGLNDDELSKIKNDVEEIDIIEGLYKKDIVLHNEKNGNDYSIALYSYNKDKKLNDFRLTDGRYPISDNEIVVDGQFVRIDYEIGDVITIIDDNLKEKDYTIVGFARSPYYISIEKGTSELLSGKVDFFVYMLESNFIFDSYNRAYIKIKTDNEAFSKEYNLELKNLTNKIKNSVSNDEIDYYKELVDNAFEKYNSAIGIINNINLYYNFVSPFVDLTEIKDIILKYKLYESNVKSSFEIINDAKVKLQNLKDAKWYVLNRNNNASYSQYYGDVSRIDSLSKVFPFIFYFVAILVILSSMVRIVKEERGKIGLFKSLGYSNREIRYKYLCYSFLSCFIGTTLGILVGTYIFPKIFIDVYSLIYFMPDIQYKFAVKDIIIASIVSFSSTIGISYIVVNNSLKESASSLLRPKKVTIRKFKLFNKLPFIKQVTIENIFKNIMYGLMAIFGIIGCMSLMIMGFGLRDSITGIINAEYNKIFTLSTENVLKSDVSQDDISSELERLNNNENVLSTATGMVQMVVSNIGNKSINIYHIVPDNSDSVGDMISMYDYDTNKKLYLDDDGVILTRKAALLLNLNVGDYFIYSVNNKTYKVKLSGIMENYVYHYMFMSKELYNKIYGSYPVNNMIFSKFDKNVSNEEIDDILSFSNIYSNIIYVSLTSNQISSVFEVFNKVIIIIIVFSGLLTFVVLYSLSMINISKKIRDIAILKSLGYKNSEINYFVNKEMVIYAILGIVLGVLFGYYMTDIVMSSCEVDAIMFIHNIQFKSYIYSVLFVIVFMIITSCFVNLSIKKISMTKLLKNVE